VRVLTYPITEGLKVTAVWGVQVSIRVAALPFPGKALSRKLNLCVLSLRDFIALEIGIREISV